MPQHATTPPSATVPQALNSPQHGYPQPSGRFAEPVRKNGWALPWACETPYAECCCDPNGDLDVVFADRLPLYVDFEFFLRNGSTSTMGGGAFEDHIKTSWVIDGGARQPIGQWRCFLFYGELGGGFARLWGTDRTQRTEPILFFRDPDDNHTHDDGFFFTRLRELRRTTVHTAIGSYWTPNWMSCWERIQMQVNCRTGVRLGHVKAYYDQSPSDDLRPVIENHFSDNHFGPGTGGHGRVEIYENIKQSEILLGVFWSIGAGVTWHDVQLPCCMCADITVAADVEFAHDWFGLGGFGAGDNGVWTVSPLFSVSLGF